MWLLCDIVPAGVGVEGDGERCIHGAGTPPAIPPSQHHLLIVTINCFISILVLYNHLKNSKQAYIDLVVPSKSNLQMQSVYVLSVYEVYYFQILTLIVNEIDLASWNTSVCHS